MCDGVCVFQEESRASKASVPRLDTPTCELPADWGIYPLVWKQLWLNNRDILCLLVLYFKKGMITLSKILVMAIMYLRHVNYILIYLGMF